MQDQQPAPSTISQRTTIPLGWAITLACAAGATAFKVVVSQVEIEHKLDTTIEAQNKNQLDTKSALEDIRDKLDHSYVQKENFQTFIDRLRDLNPEIQIPPFR